jgi:hypothetical protein
MQKECKPAVREVGILARRGRRPELWQIASKLLRAIIYALALGENFVQRGLSLLSFGCDGNINVSALFELYIIAVFVSQRILNAEVSISVDGPTNSNLCLFRLARTSRRDDFVNGSGHRGTWPFWNSGGIKL